MEGAARLRKVGEVLCLCLALCFYLAAWSVTEAQVNSAYYKKLPYDCKTEGDLVGLSPGHVEDSDVNCALVCNQSPSCRG